MKSLLAIAGSVVLVAAVVPPVRAQQPFANPGAFTAAQGPRGPGFQSPVHGPFRGGRRGGFGHARPRGRYFNRSGFILPYFYPPDYYGGYYEPPETQAPSPQVLVVKTAAPEVEPPPAPPPESLVLELHGNHWVRITDSGESEVGPAAAKAGAAQVPRQRTAVAEAAQPPRVLPAAVLVFRNGHEEQTTKYTIIGRFIYTSTDYWNGGAWTRKIPIAQLDVPATLRANQERGVKFNLPSVPNEIVVRP